MALYVTGDKHARMSELINFINRFELNENDAIVVCGDMGYILTIWNGLIHF